MLNFTPLARRVLASPVGKNAFSLYLIQFANYVLPLVTVPYLVRVLGAQRFGTLAFGQGLMAYFAAMVSYGFDWSATRRISVERNRADDINHLVANVWAAKSLLYAAGFGVLLLLIQAVPRVHAAAPLLIILFGGVLGDVLFPTWLFQGLERMVPISAINMTTRVLVVIGMLILVHRPQDFLVYAALSSGGGILAGLVGVRLSFRTLGVRFVSPSWAGVRACLREGNVLFLSNSAITLYTTGNAFILGLFAGDAVVGYYAAAEKIAKVGVSLLGPLSQALFPRFSRLAEESRARALRWGRALLLAVGGVGMLLSVGIFLGAAVVVRIVLGPGYAPCVPVLRILAPLPFLVAVSNVLGVQLMIPFGRERAVLVLVVAAGFLNVSAAALLAPHWKAEGMAASVALAEFFISATYFAYLWMARLNPIRSVDAAAEAETYA